MTQSDVNARHLAVTYDDTSCPSFDCAATAWMWVTHLYARELNHTWIYFSQFFIARMYTSYSPQWKVVTKKLTIRLSQIFTGKVPNNSTPLMSPSFLLWKLSESSKTSCVHWWLPGQVTQCVKSPYSSKNPQSRPANHLQPFPFNHGKSWQSC